jgi:cobyric acid synthase
MIILPGGSLVESQTIKAPLTTEILKMADQGKLVLGICSGFQILSRGTDIGRLSPTPIFQDGLGLLDAEFAPLICTDQVQATTVGTSTLTNQIGTEVSGFHCHTYGNLKLHKTAHPILVSHVKRLNYRHDPQDLVSGVSNREGNVVGVLMHALLDQNPSIIQTITQSLGITETGLQTIKTANAQLQTQIKSEIGIATNLYPNTSTPHKTPHVLMVTALGSGSGKTFIVTGLAGALKKMGFKVGVVKVGGDIRDLVPALYLLKEPIKRYSSIKIGESGWTTAATALQEAGADYDFLLIEGAMSAFTGLLMDNAPKPSSTVEVAAALGIPTVVVVGCDKEGIEGALISSLSYVNLLRRLGVNITGVILNKARLSYLTDEIRQVMQHAFTNANVNLLGTVPRIDLEGRGAIPEVEIKYDLFGEKAFQTIKTYLDMEKIVAAATPTPITKTQLDYQTIKNSFKTSIESNLGFASTEEPTCL